MTSSTSSGAKQAQQISAFTVFRLVTGSILSSVVCVLSNKKIFVIAKVPLLLTSCHFLSTFLVGKLLHLVLYYNDDKKKKKNSKNTSSNNSNSINLNNMFSARYPAYEAWKIGIIGSMTIGCMNLSLDMNSVGFYQLSKIGVVPSMVLFNYAVYGKTTSMQILISLIIICWGLFLATVTDVQLLLGGLVLGVCGIVFTCLYQLGMEQCQKKYNISGTQMQFDISGPQFLTAFVFVLPMELLPLLREEEGNSKLYSFVTDPVLLQWVAVSCLSAQSLNYHCFTIIGKLSALTYQLSTHLKTILILYLGLVLFPNEESTEYDKWHYAGMVISVVGFIAYSYVKHLEGTRKSD